MRENIAKARHELKTDKAQLKLWTEHLSALDQKIEELQCALSCPPGDNESENSWRDAFTAEIARLQQKRDDARRHERLWRESAERNQQLIDMAEASCEHQQKKLPRPHPRANEITFECRECGMLMVEKIKTALPPEVQAAPDDATICVPPATPETSETAPAT